MKKLVVLVLLALCGCAKNETAPVLFAGVVASDLQQACNGRGGKVGEMSCAMFIHGVRDTMEFERVRDGRVWLCHRPDFPSATGVVIRYMAAHPDRLHYSGTQIVQEALANSYGRDC